MNTKQSASGLRRGFSLLLAIVMVLSLLPASIFAADNVYTVAGTESLCGTAWEPGNMANAMTLNAEGIYEKTYSNVAPGTHEFKVTDGTWNNSWGNGSGNYVLTLETESHVTILFDAATKEITVAVEALVPAVHYYLFGYINGANYGCEEDYANLGEYRFADGKLRATFEQTSYVAVKTDLGGWYMTDGWLGAVTSATLYDTALLGENANKLEVPAGVEMEFALTVNEDGTLTLSYTKVDVAPAATYIVAGDAGLCGSNWQPTDTANQMTYNPATGLYEKVYANVAPGEYSLKVTDGSWSNAWGSGGDNYVFQVATACDVTVTFDEAAKTVAAYGDGLGQGSTGFETIHAVGNGKGNWLSGENWNAGSNVMAETVSGVYELTCHAVTQGQYEVKFAANGNWTHSWGGAYAGSGVEAEAVYNGTNIAFEVPYAAADVTLKLDLSAADAEGKSGGKFTITITAVAAPEVEYTYTVHYGNPNGWNTVKAHGWCDTGDLFGGWPGTDMVPNAANEGWYDITVTTKTDSVGFVFHNGAGTQTGNFIVDAPAGQTEVEVWITDTIRYMEPDTWDGKTGNKVQLHFLRGDWGPINAWVWADAGNVPGYEEYHQIWPGKAIFENPDHAGWYDLTVVTELEKVYVIFNDGANKTKDLVVENITSDLEFWVVGDALLTEAPSEWTGILTYTANLHFQKPSGWGETVNGWIWDENGAISGYEQYNTAWPGAPVAEDPMNDGWYTVSVTTLKESGFYFSFNDGTIQTDNLKTGPLQKVTDLWVVDGQVLSEAPAGWVDANRTVHVPGSFPGPGWDASSHQMTYDRELGLYVYTFENVPAANYEYKIAINGSWDENYGLGGERDGANIPVAVPEQQDVTVYYHDGTHNSVTDVTYVFADIDLTGTGIPADTKLQDAGLTGIYSAEVALAAGSYADVILTYEGSDYPFPAFTLESDKVVTFYFDPGTGIFYHNGSDEKVNGEAIFFDSKDESYKAPFGAVATGQETAFAITTGDDVTAATLVVKGVGSFPMEKKGDMWTCSPVFNTIGEYDYYFALSNGFDVKVYGDDDGYYGPGKVSDLGGVLPYDLVVYENGFKTPDWMKNAVIYQIFPDRFFDGDEGNNRSQTTARGAVDYEYITDWYTLPENPEQKALLDEETYKATGAWYGDGEWSNEIYGGDLEGITDRIDYLKALGVNVIYLNPVFASISNHRYDACDYLEIDPILGDLGDFRELVKVAERHDMHIILDGVFNHVSDDSVYFDRYYKFLGTSEKVGAYPYWAYVYDYMAETGADQSAAETAAKVFFGENYGITDYSYTEWFAVLNTPMAGAVDSIGLRAGKTVYSYEGWWGYDSMPVIKSTDGSEYQTGNWAEEIISGPDSVTQYWITEGNNGWRLDVANEVSDETWQRFRESVKGLDSDAVIIGEIWDDATKYLKGDMYDSVMNYLFRGAVTDFAKGTKDSVAATNELERIRERYPEEAFYAMMNLVGSHDTTRVLSYLDGIADDRSQKDIDSAFPTYEKTSDAAKEMQHLVAFLQFTYPGAPTIYYGDEIGMVGSDDPDDRRAFEWGKGQQELVEWYARLAAIRESYPALRTGDLTIIDTQNPNLMGYTRSLKRTELIVLANNAAEDVSYAVEGRYMDLVSGTRYDGTVPARSGVILVKTSQYRKIRIDAKNLAPAYDPSYIVAVRADHVHAYTAVKVEGTCCERGYTEHKCTICGDSYRDNYRLKNPWNHGETVLENQREATCTSYGYTGDEVCVDCGRTTKHGHHIPKLRHEYVDGLCIHCGARCSIWDWWKKLFP